ncbi:TPA: ABC transporter permease [Streptococcus equi subsp. zooepidemicus]|nr:ABC transporter permease [Streptococcus equi subsp. zooepidemicus]HEL0040852.1 ABC transporter permease [Streptococcus equi subsp. zooepidemicus]HEL0042804.1 ABC transporter permease [Streptococcus equi subsp. zooepidemicus]HEL0044786.1 ABC transporter permease [Streptococcus equi subsp. zooepidemicus]HEL0052841.1 ABC transporter permease [Streptococcus equi subsp. zooepidemicus]
MNWSTIWELVKINILYSNPQSLTALKKKQEKAPKENFKAYKSMIRQQALMIALFLVIYIFMFMGVDFSQYPGLLSLYIAIFFVMATVNAFTAMYAVFYESNDVKLYVHLPIRSEELFIAKLISSLGMGSIFLMPLLSLFVIAYWQIIGNALAIVLAFILFVVLFVSSIVFALYLNAWIGRIILRSSKRKLVSAVLMFASTFGALGLIVFLNMTNNQRMMADQAFSDRPLIPYFRGSYDVVVAPLSSQALLNFWLPLLLVMLMLYGLVRRIMPAYYRETLYVGGKAKNAAVARKAAASDRQQSLQRLLTKHHLATLQNATLLTQTYLMPLIYVMIFITPSVTSGAQFSSYITDEYFGIALLVGVLLGSICTVPTSFVGVGISLEKDNFTFIKTLPISLKGFLLNKFRLLIGLQILAPLVVYALIGLFVLGFHPVIVLSFSLGFVLMGIIQGQLMFRRDYRMLDLKWQDVTQLFTRGNSQWFMLGLMFGDLIVGGFLIVLAIMCVTISQQPLLVSIAVSLILLSCLLFAQLWLQRSFWKNLNKM